MKPEDAFTVLLYLTSAAAQVWAAILVFYVFLSRDLARSIDDAIADIERSWRQFLDAYVLAAKKERPAGVAEHHLNELFDNEWALRRLVDRLGQNGTFLQFQPAIETMPVSYSRADQIVKTLHRRMNLVDRKWTALTGLVATFTNLAMLSCAFFLVVDYGAKDAVGYVLLGNVVAGAVVGWDMFPLIIEDRTPKPWR